MFYKNTDFYVTLCLNVLLLVKKKNKIYKDCFLPLQKFKIISTCKIFSS